VNVIDRPRTDIDILEETWLNDDVPCGSVFCALSLHRKTHAAHYNAKLLCGHSRPICRNRVTWYSVQAFVVCATCGESADTDRIILTEL